ncbi:MAG TPA: hypothetical protein VMN81_04485 [Vicinamibacterales bacterium]|nr:hypothetical protein [Vicinamibacterales bacterium]
MRRLTCGAAAALAVAAALIAGAAAVPVSGQTRPGGQAARSRLVDLDNLAALKTAFNNNRGDIRIVLLLSPT